MLTEGQMLYLLVALIYLSECVVWLPGHAFAFIGTWSGRWRVLLPGAGLGNDRGRFILTNPLPFAGGLAVATQWPLAVGEIGMASLKVTNPGHNRRPLGLFSHLPWNVEHFAAFHRTVAADGVPIFNAANFREAQWLATFLAGVAEKSGRRSAVVKLLRETLDTKKLADRLGSFAASAQWLTMLAVVEFILLFVCAPIAWHLGGSWRFLLTIGALLLHTIIGSILFYRAHRRLYPERKLERFQQSLLVALVPTHSIRAVDSLSRGLVGDFHALAVAAVMTSEPEFQRTAGVLLRDLRHPMPLATDADAPTAETATAFHEVEREMLEKFLADGKLPPVLEHPPVDSADAAWCPRCLATYMSGVATCADCQGIPLKTAEVPAQKP